MTASNLTTHTSGRGRIRPGSPEFTLLLAFSMAATALSIDTLLPALSKIRVAFDLGHDKAATAGLVTMFMLGSGLSLLPSGLLADRYGRRSVLWGGFALYLIGAVGSALAPNLGLMLIARFVWGVGAAGPRVTAMAMVRDVYSGERMAKQMSFMMAVFILVPVFAPSLGAVLTAVAHWRFVFWFCAIASIGIVAWSLRLPETLPDEARRGLSLGDISAGTRSVLATPGTLWYLAALVPLFGVFVAYLSSSELLLDDVYDLKKWFPFIFSAQAASMGVMMVLNGRFVERIGLDRLNRTLLVAYAAVTLALAAVALGTDGHPRFWLFTILLTLALACHGVLSPNLSSAAMRPLGRVAGLGAAILAMLPTVLGSLIADRINGAFAGNVTPFAVTFGASGVIALLAHERAVAAADRTRAAVGSPDAVRSGG